jgi:hypothetical protein
MHGLNYSFLFRGESIPAMTGPVVQTQTWRGGHGAVFIEVVGGEELLVQLRFFPDNSVFNGPFPFPVKADFVGDEAVATIEFALPPGRIQATVNPGPDAIPTARIGVFEVNQRSVV